VSILNLLFSEDFMHISLYLLEFKVFVI